MNSKYWSLNTQKSYGVTEKKNADFPILVCFPLLWLILNYTQFFMQYWRVQTRNHNLRNWKGVLPGTLHFIAHDIAYCIFCNASSTRPQSEASYITEMLREEWWTELITDMCKSLLSCSSTMPFMVVLFLFFRTEIDNYVTLILLYHRMWLYQWNKWKTWTSAQYLTFHYHLPSRVEDLLDDHRAVVWNW